MKHVYLCLFAEEDGEFSVFVPDLPGCQSAGDDLPHAREMVREALTLWIEVTAEFGDPIPEPRMSTIAEAEEWYHELLNYPLDGDSQEDDSAEEADLHAEMIEVEVNLSNPAAR